MKKKQTKYDLFIKELVFLTKKINPTSKIQGTLLLVSLFSLILTNSLFSVEIRHMLESSMKVSIPILYINLLLKPAVLISVGMKVIFRDKRSLNYQKTVDYTNFTLDSFLIFVLTIKEFMVYPLNSMLYTAYFTSGILRNVEESGNIMIFFSDFFVIIDWILAIAVCYFKVKYLRDFSPLVGSFFAKQKGVFEELLVMFITINCATAFSASENGQNLKWIFFCFKSLFSVIMIYFYMKELPYFKKEAEQQMAYLIVFTPLICLIHEFYNKDFNSLGKVLMILFPFVAYTIKVYLENSYQITDGSNIDKSLTTCVKLTICKERIDESVSFIYRNSFKIHLSRSKHKRLVRGQDQVEDVSEADIDLAILEKLMKRDQSNYPLLIKVIWHLEFKISVKDIIRLRDQMLSNSKSFHDKLLYYYAKEQISLKLKSLYQRPWNKLEPESKFDLDNRRMKSNLEQKIKSLHINHTDLSYVFEYKDKLEILTKKIEEYNKLNKKFLTHLRAQSKSLKVLDKNCKFLYDLDEEIKISFRDLHKNTRQTDTNHFSPYFLYLNKVANLQRSASEIFKIYKKRMVQKKNLLHEDEKFFTDENMMINSLIFKVESSDRGFGTILDVYGNPKLLKGKKELGRLKGMNINSMIADSLTKHHQEACTMINEKNYETVLNSQKQTFLKNPETGYLEPVTIMLMIMPSVKDNFKYMSGVRFHPSDPNFYLILDDHMNVSAFSQNFQELFEDENYLQGERKMRNLSEQVAEFLCHGNENQYISEGGNSKEKAKHMTSYLGKQKKWDSASTFSADGKNSRKVKKIISDFSFKHKITQEVVKLQFKAEILKKKFDTIDYNYTYLKLKLVDQDLESFKMIRSRKEKINNKMLSHSSVSTEKKNSKKKFPSKTGDLEEKMKHPPRSPSPNFLGDKPAKKFTRKNSYLENNSSFFNEEDDDSLTSNFSNTVEKEKIIAKTGSVFSTTEMQLHKKYFAFEDAIKRTPLLLNVLMVFLGYLGSLSATIYLTLYLQTELEKTGIIFEEFNDIFTTYNLHYLELQSLYGKVLSGVAYNDGIYKKNRLDFVLFF